jgi:hypothetical protein
LTANRRYYGLKNQLRSHYISVKTKCKLYKTLIQPVLLYGCETWAIGKNDESTISIFERKVLRKIYGPVNDKIIWRIRYNNELHQLLGEPDIIKEVKASRVRWLVHLFRGNESNPCRKLTFTRPEGTRRVGRPPKRWLQCNQLPAGCMWLLQTFYVAYHMIWELVNVIRTNTFCYRGTLI